MPCHELMKAEESLLSLTHEELAFEGTSASELKSQLAETKNSALAMKPINIPDREGLGPRAFRDWLQQEGIEVNQMQSNEVITQIDELFLKVSGNRIDQEYSHDESIASKINRSYNLMNWAGYYPDDFTRVKKGRDRFRASWNDMNHVAHASGYTYLVSSDERFSKKAEACYAHLGVTTKIVTPKDLVRYFP